LADFAGPEGHTFPVLRKQSYWQVNTTRSTSSGYTSTMIEIGSHPVWHPVFETLAYVGGFAVYRWMRGRTGDVIDEPKRWTILAAAAVGALVGSRVLGIAEQWPTVMTAVRAGQLMALVMSPGGKTIVGGLLGGWIAVEVVKRLNGIQQRTGDLFAVPLCVGIAIGRVGCLLAGIADDTYGVPTKLPWAVDLGDGVGRHPVQVYEIVFLILLAVMISRPWKLREGARFGIFLASYLVWRVGIDFLKPQPLMDGLNLIQWSCLGGLVLLGMDWFVLARRRA
jgi:phosphatidylglycerol---prolipoprotein diacylglyceryl transferase